MPGRWAGSRTVQCQVPKTTAKVQLSSKTKHFAHLVVLTYGVLYLYSIFYNSANPPNPLIHNIKLSLAWTCPRGIRRVGRRCAPAPCSTTGWCWSPRQPRQRRRRSSLCKLSQWLKETLSRNREAIDAVQLVERNIFWRNECHLYLTNKL